MIKRFIIIILLCSFLYKGNAQRKYPIPTNAQYEWSASEIGVIFHYDLHVFDSKKYNQKYNRIVPIDDYNIFNPLNLNTDQWVKVAKDAGAKFALLTVTHETGFALYQSDVNPFCLKALKWKNGRGDILRDFINSCHKFGIKPGIYIGIRWNSRLGIYNFKALGDETVSEIRQKWYKHYCERIVEELTTKYGDLFMIWFDGGADDPKGLGPDVEPIIRKNQPHCLFYHNINRADLRWAGSETGTVPNPCWSMFPTQYSHNRKNESHSTYLSLLKHGDVNGKYWVPAMADTPLRGANGRHEWFWEPKDKNAVRDLRDLINIYYKSVGRNATLVLGLTPDNRGLIPRYDSIRMSQLGFSIKELVGNPILRKSGVGKEIILDLDGFRKINQVILQENIKLGQRVRHYIIEGFNGNKWIKLYTGNSIGYKHIAVFDTANINKIRLVIDSFVDEPHIKNFSAYNSPINKYLSLKKLIQE